MDGDGDGEEEKNEDEEEEDEDGDEAILTFQSSVCPFSLSKPLPERACLKVTGSGKPVACVFGARHGTLLRHRNVSS